MKQSDMNVLHVKDCQTHDDVCDCADVEPLLLSEGAVGGSGAAEVGSGGLEGGGEDVEGAGEVEERQKEGHEELPSPELPDALGHGVLSLGRRHLRLSGNDSLPL